MSNTKQDTARRPAGAPRFAEGVILLDTNHRVLAFDPGAIAILKEANHDVAGGESPVSVPPRILEVLRDPDAVDTQSRKVRLPLGDQTYCCRIHVTLARPDGFSGPITVVHLTREVSMNDAVTMISEEYRLTVREQQALRGVLRGLTSKQVAEQMSISPNTVKAFLRLVMGKMGVSSRTGIVAKLFDSNGHD